MTTETNHFDLQAVFAEASQDLDDEAFTGNVMAKTRRLIYRVLAVAALLVLILLLCAWWFEIPAQHFGLMLTEFLATPLIDLGDSWAGWMTAPVNNIAALLVLTGKLLRVAWKKMVGASYA